jgi:hypothetical protein
VDVSSSGSCLKLDLVLVSCRLRAVIFMSSWRDCSEANVTDLDLCCFFRQLINQQLQNT